METSRQLLLTLLGKEAIIEECLGSNLKSVPSDAVVTCEPVRNGYAMRRGGVLFRGWGVVRASTATRLSSFSLRANVVQVIVVEVDDARGLVLTIMSASHRP